jgi:hypothetical protein
MTVRKLAKDFETTQWMVARIIKPPTAGVVSK